MPAKLRLTGMEKKAVVLRVFDNLMDELPNLYPMMSEDMKVLVEQTKLMLPSVVDMLVSLGRKKMNLSFDDVKKCWKGLSCC